MVNIIGLGEQQYKQGDHRPFYSFYRKILAPASQMN